MRQQLSLMNKDIYLNKKVKILFDLKEAGVKAMEIGNVTAYLPQDEIFAIFFGPEKWITFFEDEDSFLKKIELIK